jgi:hypothetical protein
MKLDPGMHIIMHLVFFGKTGVTVLIYTLIASPGLIYTVVAIFPQNCEFY